MNQQNMVENLEDLEFFPSIYHSRVLSTLIQSVHPLNAGDISKHLGIADSKVYPTLKELEEWGLIKADLSKRPKEFYFDNPHILQSFLEDKYELEQKEKSKADIKYCQPRQPDMGT